MIHVRDYDYDQLTSSRLFSEIADSCGQAIFSLTMHPHVHDYHDFDYAMSFVFHIWVNC